MIQDIKYNGLADNVSDYEVPDGTLETSLNLLNEDGTLNPIQQPEVACSLDAGEYIIFIHKTQQYTNYIVLDERNVSSRNLLWFSQSAMDAGGTISPAQLDSHFSLGEHEVVSINAVGNTLIVVADNTMHYFLWKQGGGNTYYKYLGTHLPQLDISFGLQTKPEYMPEFDVPMTKWPDDEYLGIINYRDITFSYDNNLSGLIDETAGTITAKLNKFITEHSVDKDKFLFPFLVRYAYRLYDGETLTMHSAPVLMIPTSLSPQVFINSFKFNDGRTEFQKQAKAFIGAFVADLDYYLINSKSVLNDWQDIVQSVDIFVSLPIYTYNQDGKVWGWKEYGRAERGYTMSKILQSASTDPLPDEYWMTWATPLLVPFYGDARTFPVIEPGKVEFKLERYSDDEIHSRLAAVSNFYHIKSIPLNELQDSGRNVISLDKGTLATIASRERMTDDYDSHDYLLPQTSFNYNKRLHMGDITKTLSNPFRLGAYIPHMTKYFDTTGVSTTNQIYVYIRQEGHDFVLTQTNNTTLPPVYPFIYLHYTNPNAYKIVIAQNPNNGQPTKYYSFDLEKHDFLNGAFYFKTILTYTEPPTTTAPTTTDNNHFSLGSRLYVSDVENPFIFNVRSIDTIGTGKIIGMASATQAISEGQFGQYPLYVFTTDGVWALRPDREANYREADPVTRDVCVNAHSITPIDNAVLFAAQRGIMLLHGGTSTCISDSLFNHTPFDVTTLPHLDFASLATILPTYIEGTKLYSDYLIPLQPDCMVPFPEFLKRCRMLFDYTNQRIIVFNPATDTQEYDPVVPVVPDDPNAPDTPVEQDDNTPGIGPLPLPLSSSTDTEAAIPTLLHPYAYVYSLKTKRWGMMVSSFYSSLNAYPDALAMDISSKVLSLRLPSAPSPLPLRSLLVTRPLKLGNGNVLKSVHTVVHRGQFPTDKVRTLLYGSRDLLSWHLIASSKGHEIRNLRGTPYKYFRVATIADLTEGQSIYGVSIEFDVRQTNRLH